MVRTILLHVDHVVHPGDYPVTNRKTVLPIHWLGAAHHNRREKRFGERPYPVKISH